MESAREDGRAGDPHMIPELLSAQGHPDSLQRALHAVREHLGMEVAFVSRIAEGRRQFIRVDASSDEIPIRVGDSHPVDEGYCLRVVQGSLPELIRDARLLPAALELPVTTTLPIGAHLSVPIRMKDGSVYGTLCCFSRTPDQTLSHRDLAMMRVFAEFAAEEIERQRQGQRARNEIRERVQRLWEPNGIKVVYQPIYDFLQDRIAGFEALARFAAAPQRPPDVWFDEAAQAGLGEALQVAVIESALAALGRLPRRCYLSLNISPEHIVSGVAARVLQAAPLKRIVLEVTEHAAIAEYTGLAAQLQPLRRRGLRLAIDDAGAGFASLRHILYLNPDIIKLDMSLIRDIDADRKRQALASALIRFAEQTASRVTAEGVETAAELKTLRRLGVGYAQGYLLGRPMPVAELPSSRRRRSLGAVRRHANGGRLSRRNH